MFKKLFLILFLFSLNSLNSFERINNAIVKNGILPFLIEIDDSSPENLVKSLMKLLNQNVSRNWKVLLIDQIKREIKNRKINVNVSDNTTPLHIAARNGYATITQILIECGAIVNITIGEKLCFRSIKTNAIPDYSCFGPLKADLKKAKEMAAEFEIVSDSLLLLVKDWTPLHEAVFYNQLDVAKILIKSGADKKIKATMFPSCICGPHLEHNFSNQFLTFEDIARLRGNYDELMKISDENEPLTQELENNEPVEPPAKSQKVS